MSLRERLERLAREVKPGHWSPLAWTADQWADYQAAFEEFIAEHPDNWLEKLPDELRLRVLPEEKAADQPVQG